MFLPKMYLFLLTAACFIYVSLSQSPRYENRYLDCSVLVKFKNDTKLMQANYSSDEDSNIFLTEDDCYALGFLDEVLSTCGTHEIDIRELTIRKIQELFDAKKLTSMELTQCYLERIEKMDPFLKSVIELNPEALTYASMADCRRNSSSSLRPTGLLLGIPILIKDNIGTIAMETTAGAKALEYIRTKRDAEVVNRLKLAGAVILGKTNPSEWANFRGTHIPDGWSGRGGQTHSPYVGNKIPGGSSSGSAVAVAANLAVASLGTETDGSIIGPSMRNAVVGLKTSYGRVPLKGVIPLSYTRDVVGPMARTAEDAAILFGAISGSAGKNDQCGLGITSCFIDYSFHIGVVRGKFGDVPPYYKQSVPVYEDILKKLHHTLEVNVIDLLETPEPPEIDPEDVLVVLGHEFKYSLNKYLEEDVQHCESHWGRNINTLHDIIKFNKQHSSFYDQSLLETSDQTDGIQNTTYVNALNRINKISKEFLDSLFKKNDISAVAFPCASYLIRSLYTYGANAGYPSIAVPVGVFDNGIPFSMCLLGQHGSDGVLLRLAYLIEKVRPDRRPRPHFNYFDSEGAMAF